MTELAYSETEGRYWIATKDYARGDVVYKAPALVIALKNKCVEHYCSACCFQFDSMKACAACRSVYYCSQKCQKSHWRAIHKLECQYLEKQYPERPDTDMWAVMRMLLLIRDGRGAAIEDMHSKDKTPANAFDKPGTKIYGLSQLVDCPDLAHIIKLYQIFNLSEMHILVAGCELTLSDSARLSCGDAQATGSILDPHYGFYNHSCMPNAHLTSFGNCIMVYVQRPIARGEAINVHYLSVRLPIQIRREELLKRYDFMCACQRCARYPVFENQFEVDTESYFCCGKPLAMSLEESLPCSICKQTIFRTRCVKTEVIMDQLLSQFELPVTTILETIERFRTQGHWSPRHYVMERLHMKATRGLTGDDSIDHALVLLHLPLSDIVLEEEMHNLSLIVKHLWKVESNPETNSFFLRELDYSTRKKLSWYFSATLLKHLQMYSQGGSKAVIKLTQYVLLYKSYLQMSDLGRGLIKQWDRSEQEYTNSLKPVFARFVELEKTWLKDSTAQVQDGLVQA